jgi:hypothetical protein
MQKQNPIPPAHSAGALTVTDGTVKVGSIVIWDGSYFSFGADETLLGEFKFQREAMRAIPVAGIPAKVRRNRHA